MTKKHFIEIARSIALHLKYALSDDVATATIQRAEVQRMAKLFADVAAADNGRFDRDRFMSACGF